MVIHCIIVYYHFPFLSDMDIGLLQKFHNQSSKVVPLLQNPVCWMMRSFRRNLRLETEADSMASMEAMAGLEK